MIISPSLICLVSIGPHCALHHQPLHTPQSGISSRPSAFTSLLLPFHQLPTLQPAFLKPCGWSSSSWALQSHRVSGACAIDEIVFFNKKKKSFFFQRRHSGRVMSLCSVLLSVQCSHLTCEQHSSGLNALLKVTASLFDRW